MTAFRLGLAALLAAPLAMVSVGPALADTTTVAGNQLVLTDTLSDSVVIGTDPSLSSHVRISLDGGLSCLSVTGGAQVVVATAGCGSDAGTLRLDIPPDMPVTLTSTSSEDVHVGDLRGPLVATMNGNGDLAAGHTGGLVLVLRGHADVTAGDVDGPASVETAGNNDVTLKEVRGPLSVRKTGHGDLIVGGLTADAAAIEAAGSGDITIGHGHIGTLSARLRGANDLSVAARIDGGSVDVAGSGAIRLDDASASVQRHTSGSNHTRSLTYTSPHVLGHVLTFAFVLLAGYIAWRLVRRGRRAPATSALANPAVTALSDTMGRLDQRLGRVEAYVTTRELDLNRKFREL